MLNLPQARRPGGGESKPMPIVPDDNRRAIFDVHGTGGGVDADAPLLFQHLLAPDQAVIDKQCLDRHSHAAVSGNRKIIYSLAN